MGETVNGDVTGAEELLDGRPQTGVSSASVDAAGAVMETDYNAQTILAATADDTPAPVTVGESQVVGRAAAGNVGALTATQLRTIANVADGADVTGDNAPQAHAGTHVTDGGDTIADAVAAGNSGLMSGADKTKIDGVEAGAEVNEIKGDGTDGRVLRSLKLRIQDGTNASTIKCTTIDNWNGDVISATDNIGKGATVGDFTLNATGASVTIEASGLSGNAVAVLAVNISYNDSNSTVEFITPSVTGNDLVLAFRTDNAGNDLDLTVALASAEIVDAIILYLADA